VVKTSEVNAESKRTILFMDKKNGGAMRRSQRADETNCEVFVNESPE
jgi:hypothetical protein